jgi:hypothetical protein
MRISAETIQQVLQPQGLTPGEKGMETGSATTIRPTGGSDRLELSADFQRLRQLHALAQSLNVDPSPETPVLSQRATMIAQAYQSF